VEIVFLVDTNIFLEILLGQEKKTICKEFLDNNAGNLNISDFSLHSLGVILFRYDKEEVFRHFIEDVFPKIVVLSLPEDSYLNIIKSKEILKLDFDDSYQYGLAKHYELTIVTLDKDFEKIQDINVRFL
jgi:predicted nucleic acid-binding protein